MNNVCRICCSGTLVRSDHCYYPHLYSCRSCGVKFVWPQPTLGALRALYNQEYFCNPESASGGYDNYYRDKGVILKTFNRRLDWIEKYRPARGRLLDLGCGMGFFLEVASSRGWDVYGVDVSDFAVSLVTAGIKEKVFAGALEGADFPENHFDVITAWDYLEHVTNPQSVLAVCRKILKPGGLLALTTPDVGSWVAKAAGENWMGYKRDHLFYFSRRSLAILLERNNFLIRRSFFVGKHIMAKWFMERLGIYFPTLSMSLRKIHSLLCLPDFHFYFNPHDTVMVIAQKRAIKSTENRPCEECDTNIDVGGATMSHYHKLTDDFSPIEYLVAKMLRDSRL